MKRLGEPGGETPRARARGVPPSFIDPLPASPHRKGGFMGYGSKGVMARRCSAVLRSFAHRRLSIERCGTLLEGL